MKQYAKNKEFYVAQLEAEVAMARTLPQAMKQGDVKAERKGKGTPKYTLCKLHNSIDGAAVARWRQLADDPPAGRPSITKDPSPSLARAGVPAGQREFGVPAWLEPVRSDVWALGIL